MDGIKDKAENINKTNEKTTKEKIFETAIDLFSRKGFNAVSIREITGEVGIKESSLYNHFKSKDEILDGIFEYFKKSLGDVSFPEENIDEMIGEKSPYDFFINNIVSFRNRLTPTLESIWRIIYIEQFRDKRARDFILQEIHQKPVDFYEKVFKRMIEKGLIKPLDPRILAYEYNYTLTQLSLEYIILHYDNEDTSTVGRKMFEHTRFFCDLIKNQ